jgi:quercetin dioxygenase-like cupin family protein
MADGAIPIRRVVTGNDEQGRSRVIFDSAAPNVNGLPVPGRYITDVWVFKNCPAVISGDRDDGNLPYNFEPPTHGGHLRLTQAPAKPPDYDPTRDTSVAPLHPPKQAPGGTWERGGQNTHRSRMHKTETVDYAICLQGGRVLVLDDGERLLKPGDVVVQLGSWHSWGAVNATGRMAFVMIGAKFVE